MSMLNAAASYRREDHAAPRVPVVMPLVDVRIDVEGTVAVKLDREPYATDTPLHREDLQRLLGNLATDLETPIRVERCAKQTARHSLTSSQQSHQRYISPNLPSQPPLHAPRRRGRRPVDGSSLARTSPWLSSSLTRPRTRTAWPPFASRQPSLSPTPVVSCSWDSDPRAVAVTGVSG